MRAAALCIALLCGSALAMEQPPCNGTMDQLKTGAVKRETAPVLVWNMAGVGAVWACRVNGVWHSYHVYATWPWLMSRPSDEVSRALRRFATRPEDFWANATGQPCDWHVKQARFSAESAICRPLLVERDKLMGALK